MAIHHKCRRLVRYFVHINKTSKFLQSPDVSIELLDKEINATKQFLQNYRENVYNSACADGGEIAEIMDLDRVFPEVRIRRKKRCLTMKFMMK